MQNNNVSLTNIGYCNVKNSTQEKYIYDTAATTSLDSNVS